jgi:hypothetical protein
MCRLNGVRPDLLVGEYPWQDGCATIRFRMMELMARLRAVPPGWLMKYTG